MVALTGDPAAPRLVALRPAGEGDGFEATDLIRLGPNDLGVARAVADLVAAAAAPPAPEAPEPAQPEGR